MHILAIVFTILAIIVVLMAIAALAIVLYQEIKQMTNEDHDGN